MFGERDVFVKREQYRDRMREAEQVRRLRAGRARPEPVRILTFITRYVQPLVRSGAATVGTSARGVTLLLRRYTT